VTPPPIFTVEDLSPEQRLIQQTAAEFVEKEIDPAIERLEQKDWALARALLARCGELGLLGTDVPETFGGSGLDKTTSVVVSEVLSSAASFGAAFGAQTNLAIVPILWFGTPEQQQRYLPGLTAGTTVGAYALSESESGSDALGARARAARQPDGSWVLNGEKMWITNGGFADVFIVFAKVDGERFSAFIVERGFPGVSTGAEEHKMGLHGSSTTPLILQDARVPAANLLGEIGKGHKIAFNVLNYGRLKLAAVCSGSAKRAIAEAARYASTRRQFNQPIAAFGAIRHKLAEMTVQAYAVESMLYRTAGAIDRALASGGAREADTLETFSVDASLLKVAGSEMLDFVLDENVQIHGGNGFVRDYPAERRYRDARVNRIFEGTNEINRLLVPTLLAKRGGGGHSPLGLAILAHATRAFGEALPQQQEILMLISDIIRDDFAAESARLRAGRHGGLHLDAAQTFAHDAAFRIAAHARTAMAAMDADASTLPLPDPAPFNPIAARRRIADAVLAKQGYVF
jgi:alkylation response protein AidB-like acyl-CoA dehydrogenase